MTFGSPDQDSFSGYVLRTEYNSTHPSTPNPSSLLPPHPHPASRSLTTVIQLTRQSVLLQTDFCSIPCSEAASLSTRRATALMRLNRTYCSGRQPSDPRRATPPSPPPHLLRQLTLFLDLKTPPSPPYYDYFCSSHYALNSITDKRPEPDHEEHPSPLQHRSSFRGADQL